MIRAVYSLHMNLSKTYEPDKYESDIYALWEKSGAFTPKSRGSNKKFSIVLPPPNANGDLHVGHSLMFAIQDAVIRFHRMNGEKVLWLPGSDHAGFESQAVYEKQLAKEGKSRFDFSRDELYKQIWDFVGQNKEKYESQYRRLGASVDWATQTYTLDPKIIDTAYKTFKKLWDDGLVYRGERLVNYCTFHRTGFADVEVEYQDSKTPLYFMKYGPFTLATTRPETKFGDTAVAIHPDDKRYKEWVGKTVTVEGVNGPFDVMVIADEMVDPKFGTGVVKITPAHSFDDWEVAQRHNLPAVRVIEHDGTMNEKAGKYRGMTVLEARKAVVQALKEKDLLIKVDENYHNRVGKCYKCGTIIEPMLMEQWFVDMEPLAKRAIDALKSDKITFYPDSKKTQLIKYLENLKDWNISRQIAWGIPIPAFQNINDTDDWIFNTNIDQELMELDGKTYRRDPDVFDTWFSSSSWPYATLGLPENRELAEFYPNSLMETGGEILYPWVSRMIMLGLYVMDEVPFKEVYIHGYVLSEDGSKMSKSVGNVISPLTVLDKYGSDALRMGLLAGRAPAVNRGYDPRRVEEARNFCNKLWNIARYIEGVVGDAHKRRHVPQPVNIADQWMLSKLQQSTEVISSQVAEYKLSEAYENLYHLVWDDFADWYLEASKATPNHELLCYVLEIILKLAHPFAPFVTETIWQTLKWEDESLLITATWPSQVVAGDRKEAAEFERVKEVVSEARMIMAATSLKKPLLGFKDESLLVEHGGLISRLARLGEVSQGLSENGIRLSKSGLNAWIVTDEDTANKFVERLKTEKANASESVKKLKARLNNKSYVDNAPERLVSETRSQLEDAEKTLENITSELEAYKN